MCRGRVQEDPDLERVGLERARRLEANGLGGAVAQTMSASQAWPSRVAPVARLSAATPPRWERCAWVSAIRFQVAWLAAEAVDRLEHLFGVVLKRCRPLVFLSASKQRGRGRPAPPRLWIPGASSLAGRPAPTAGTALSTPRNAGSSCGKWRSRTSRMLAASISRPALGAHLGGVVAREEAVALQPPRRHQDEDAERGVAEAEPLGFLSA